MGTRAIAMLVAFGVVLTLRAYPQQASDLVQVARIDLKEHPDSFRLFSGSDEDYGRRAPLFAVTTTPDGDLVELVATQSGPWHLVRVREWFGQRPVVQRLNIPGSGGHGSSSEFSVAPQILITQNGKYLVTIATDPWPSGDDATINVIDLQTFKLVVTQRASQHGLKGDWQLGPENSIRVQGVYSDPAKPIASEQWLASLSLPGLQIEERCNYSIGFNPPGSIPALKVELHGTPGPRCAQDVQNQLAQQSVPRELERLNELLNPACAIEAATPEQSYAVGTCRDCRQALFGVSCKAERSEVYAGVSNKSIASLTHAPHKLTRVVVARSHGKLYLLSVEGAGRLTVYQITARP